MSPVQKKSPYVCPNTKQPLNVEKTGLRRADGVLIPHLLELDVDPPVPNFLEVQGQPTASKGALKTYNSDAAAEVYRNFLDWLFSTFDEDEYTFRQKLVDKLNLVPGARVLITGCGLGEDLPLFFDKIGGDGEVFAQDLSAPMVRAALANLGSRTGGDRSRRVFFSVGDASELPFADDFFDAAFHFGGINLFANVKGGIGEMDRVVRPGGKVVFGDEGVAPWLRDTENGRAAIFNNALWAHEAPLSALPPKCEHVNISWILGNCFWVIDFVVSEDGPVMNMDIPHKGHRGGSMRTRYFGQLEGVTLETKEAVSAAAAAEGIGIHEWLERTLLKATNGS